MPELTIVYMQQCKSLSINQHTNLGCYKQSAIGTIFARCSCVGFFYSKKNKWGEKTCKHIKQAREEMCKWHEQFGERQQEPYVCPSCGGPTETVKVGV